MLKNIKWGIWVTDLKTFVVDSYISVDNQEYEAVYAEFDTRRAASKEANEFNKLWRGRNQVFGPKKLPIKSRKRLDNSP
jgi:hypothetical protein